MSSIDSQLFTDPAHLAQLKTRIRAEGGETSDDNLREVARQFESLFTHMLMKNMRAASLGDGAFDSEQSRFYQDMFDQQMSTELSRGNGLGIADLLVRQLGGESAPASAHSALKDYKTHAMPLAGEPRVTVRATDRVSDSDNISGPIDFVRKALPHARRVGKALGVAPQLILAQAALESGWGQKTLSNSDGSNSHNLFGIKAGSSWKGGVAVAPTTEFAAGVAERVKATFRSYDSMVESFNDYAQLLLKNPRYANVLGAGHDSQAFAGALQQSGYATDPEYGNKIMRIVNSETLKNAMHVTRQSQQR